MDSGIYIIQNLINHKAYVGSAVNFKSRWADHIKKLENKLHFNAPLQLAWNKYGKENFCFWIVEEVNKFQLVKREQFYLDMFQKYSPGIYNICQVAYSNIGIKRTQEFKSKLREARKGKRRSYEFCLKIRKANKGKKRTVEFCQRMSELKKQLWKQKHGEE